MHKALHAGTDSMSWTNRGMNSVDGVLFNERYTYSANILSSCATIVYRQWYIHVPLDEQVRHCHNDAVKTVKFYIYKIISHFDQELYS